MIYMKKFITTHQTETDEDLDMTKRVNSSSKYLFAIIAQICIIGVSLVVPIFYESDFFSIIVGSNICITMITVIVLFNCRHEKSIKKSYLSLLLFIGVSFIFNGIYYRVIGYIAIGIVFAFIIPLINFVFSENNIFSSAKALSLGTIISFIVFFLLSVCCGPALGMNQYTSFFSNPNTLGGYMIIVVAASIFLILDSCEELKKRSVLYYVIFAFSISVAIYTNSRTSILAIFIQIIFLSLLYMSYYIKNHDIKNLIRFLKKGLLIGALIIVCFSFTFVLLTNVKIAIIEHFPNMQMTTEYEKITVRDELGRMGLRYTKGVLGENGNDEFTSGRKEIWSTFIKEIHLKGHEEEGLKVVEDTRFYQKTNAHNVYLQMAYSAGALVGIAMIVLMFLVAKDLLSKIVIFFKTGKIDNEVIFTICMSLGFAIFSLTSGGYMVFTYLPTTMFYFALYTVMIKNKGRE